MRSVKKDEVFPDGICPVCRDPGMKPRRMLHKYIVPKFGFTADLTAAGEDLAFDKPQRIPTSGVMFVPQSGHDDTVRAEFGIGPHRVEVRPAETADFFVFNKGEEPDGMGFRLCKFCLRAVEVTSVDREHQQRPDHDRNLRVLGVRCPLVRHRRRRGRFRDWGGSYFTRTGGASRAGERSAFLVRSVPPAGADGGRRDRIHGLRWVRMFGTVRLLRCWQRDFP